MGNKLTILVISVKVFFAVSVLRTNASLVRCGMLGLDDSNSFGETLN